MTRALRSDCFTGNLGLGNLKLSISVCLFKASGIGRLRECVTFKRLATILKKLLASDAKITVTVIVY